MAAVAGKGRAQPAEIALVARRRVLLVAVKVAEGGARPKKSGTGGRLIFLVFRARAFDFVPARLAPEGTLVAPLPCVAPIDVVVRDL